jgi:hypothetical protein
VRNHQTWNADSVGDGSVQSSPDCARIYRKRCAKFPAQQAPVAKLSQHRQSDRNFINLEIAAKIGAENPIVCATAGVPRI